MRGHLRRRGPTTWQALLYVGREGGKSKYASRTIHAKSQRAAEKRLAEILAEWDEEQAKAKGAGLRDTMEAWLAAKDGIRDTTRLRYTESLRSIVKALGDRPVAEIDWPAEFRRLSAVYAPKTLRLWLAVVKQAIPAVRSAVRPPKLRKKTLRVPTPEEVQSLLDKLQTTRLYPFAALCYYAGLRRGEAIGLRWRSVRNGRIYVEEQAVRVPGKSRVQSDPKSSARTVVIGEVLNAILEEEKARQEVERRQWGDEWGPGEHVCQRGAGRPWGVSKISEEWRKESAELPPHRLRHAFAAHSLEAGSNLKTISERLGHASVGFTADTYGGFTSDAQHEAAAEALERFSRTVIAKEIAKPRVRRVK